MALKKTLWFLFRPLTTGKKLGNRDDGRPPKEDGFVSAVLMMMVLLCFSVAIHVCYWLPHAKHYLAYLPTILPIFRTLIIGVSLGLMTWIFVRRTEWLRSGVIRMQKSCRHVDIVNKGARSSKEQNFSIQERVQSRVLHSDRKATSTSGSATGATEHPNHEAINAVGIFIFGCGSIILDVLKIYDIVECADVSTADVTRDNVDQHVAATVCRLIDHTSRIIFTACLMRFIFVFQGISFKNRTRFRYAIFFLMTANVLLWVANFIIDYGSHANSDDHDRNSNCTNPGETNKLPRLLSDVRVDLRNLVPEDVHLNWSTIIPGKNTNSHFQHCWNHTTPFHEFMEYAEAFMSPFVLEFSLLAAGVLYEMWSTVRTDSPSSIQLVKTKGHKRHGRSEGSKDDETRALIGRGTGGSTGCDADETQTNTGLRRSSSMPHLQTNARDPVTEKKRYRTTFKGNQRLHSYEDSRGLVSGSCGLILGIVLSIILIAHALILTVKSITGDTTIIVMYVYYGYKLLFLTCLLAACWCTYRTLEDHDYNLSINLTGNDVLLLFSVSGIFLYHMFSMMAAIGSFGESVKKCFEEALPPLIFMEAVITTVLSWVQTTLLITAVCYRPSDTKSVNRFIEGIAYIAACNFAFWALDSFFEVNPVLHLSPVQSWFFEDNIWFIIYHVCVPLGTFYHFHSLFLCYQNYTVFKKGMTDQDVIVV